MNVEPTKIAMKNLFLVLFTILVYINTYAQIDFKETIVVGESFKTSYATHTNIVDLDGDGDLDILASGNELNWYENIDGLGNFGPKKIISAVVTQASFLYSIDIDNDNDIDILFSTRFQSSFTLYENIDGKGNFKFKEIIVPGPGSSQSLPVFPADVDGDGDVDIISSYITSSPRENNIVWYENTGNGVFVSEKIITTINDSSLTVSFFADDIDGDNDIDIFTAFSGDDKISWYENIDGKGDFSFKQSITVSVDKIKSLHAADLDKDGAIDLVSASENDNKIAWYKNLDGLGNFGPQQIISTNANGAQSVYTADLDNDGYLDVISASFIEVSSDVSTNDKVVVYRNIDGTGNFDSEKIITTKAYGVRFVTSSDIDGDGNMDVITASTFDDKIAWYKSINNELDFSEQISITRSIHLPNQIYSGDFDGDNDNDILSMSRYDSKIAWYENIDGKGFFGNQRVVTEKTGTGATFPKAFPFDIDGDGDLDIAYADKNGLGWYENANGKGNFSIKHILSNDPSFTSYIRASDLDGDGNMDLIIGDGNSGRIEWYENLDGNGSFGIPKVVDLTDDEEGPFLSLEVSDLDGDGDFDLMASSFDAFEIMWYENIDGKGNFNPHSFRTRENGPIYPADIDGDNDMDIVLVADQGGGGPSGNGVSWIENTDGKGDFSIEHRISAVDIHGQSIHTADIDNDGDIDVLTASGLSSIGGKLAWYENIDGKGNFTDQQIIAEVDNNSAGQFVYAADIDGDDIMDIISSYGYAGNNDTSKIAWYGNLNNSTLSVNDIELQDMVIYPNPVKDVLNIKTLALPIKIEVFNTLGRKIKAFYNKNQIDISNLKEGFYLLRILSDNGSLTTKTIIKQ